MNTHKYKFLAMTTPCVLLLHHTQESVANAAASKIYEQTRALEKKYNFYHAESWLTSIVNERSSDSITLDAETAQVLTKVREISQLTGGLFDVCVGSIKTHDNLNAGKRTRQLAEFIADHRPNREQLLEKFEQAMGLDAWQIEGNCLMFANPMTRMDLGGVIKEYAVDKAVEVLRHYGVSGMISFGGDLSVVGKKPNGEPYRIGIKDPFDTENSCMNLPVIDEALTTSGAYERQDTIAGKQYHHIIKPLTSSKTINKTRTNVSFSQSNAQDKQTGNPSNYQSKSNQSKSNPSQVNESKSDSPEILSATVVNASTLVSGMMSTALMINPDVALPAGCKVVLINSEAEVKARQS